MQAKRDYSKGRLIAWTRGFAKRIAGCNGRFAHRAFAPSPDHHEPGEEWLDRRDAICFTAGPAHFPAGQFTPDGGRSREPAVVAGISVGSLSASAFQRCYWELKRAQEELQKLKKKSRHGTLTPGMETPFKRRTFPRSAVYGLE